MRKKTITVFLLMLLTVVLAAQEATTVNWLNISQFEKAIKKKKQNVFIYIEDNRIQEEEGITKEELDRMKKHMFGFLEDESLVSYLNENFICYKFNPETENLRFQGKEYKKVMERGRSSHEFTVFLTGSERNRLPAIVLMDKNLELFEYKKALPRIKELKLVLEAERLKVNFLKENLDKDSRYLQEGIQMLKRKEQILKKEESNKDKKNTSVFIGRKNPKKLIRVLTYFESEEYKNTDLETFIKNNNK
tara:strand:+ start:834 stop:1577 length:744 start_codon:yes stop_codon:yes gene_type:complete